MKERFKKVVGVARTFVPKNLKQWAVVALAFVMMIGLLPVPALSDTELPADVNNDGVVNWMDMLEIIANFGQPVTDENT